MTTDLTHSEPGQRLLPTLVDQLAVDDPARVFVSCPSGSRPRYGYRDVTYGEFAAAVNHCSWWLESVLGRSDDFKTLRYCGPGDLRCTVLLYSAIKTGHKLFLGSLYNTVEDDLKLLEDLECNIMLVSAESRSQIAEEILLRRAMRTLTVPTLEDMLAPKDGPIYPYTKTYSQARNEPFVVLNTSGSTGPPKPVRLNHGTVAHHDLFMHAQSLGGKPLNIARFSGKRVLFSISQFHSPAVCFLAFSVYSRTVPVLLPWPVSVDTVNEAHLYARVDASFLVPNIIAGIVEVPEYLENLRRLQYITFGGSPLPRQIGNKVMDFAHLFLCFGTTECGYYALEETDPKDWEYASFSPIMGYELRPFLNDLYEFFFVRSDDGQKSQGVFSTFPSLEEYSAKDLWSRHSTKETLWLYEGRADDILIFGHNHRVHTGQMERTVQSHPAVKSVVVCGKNRPKPALLIEAQSPPRTQQERSTMLEEIWPSIQIANDKSASSYGKIAKDLVLFTSDNKPMVRAGKGSVLRDKTAELYRSDLDKMFREHAEFPPPTDN